MQPVGNTNQAIGLQLGWQTLTAAPFTVPPVRPELQVPDGHHPADRRSEHPGSLVHRNARSINARRKRPATTSRPPASRSTRSRSIPAAIRPRRCCRTAPADSSKFFLLTSAGQIVTTFNQIGTRSPIFAWRCNCIAAAELGLLKRGTPYAAAKFLRHDFRAPANGALTTPQKMCGHLSAILTSAHLPSKPLKKCADKVRTRTANPYQHAFGFRPAHIPAF